MAEPPSAGQTYHGSLTGIQRAAESGGDGGGAPVGGRRSTVDATRPSGHQAGPRNEPLPPPSGATAPAASPGSLRGFEPPGQLVAPWTPGAQLGLDGRAYAPRAVEQLHREEPAAVEGSRGAGAEPLPSEASPPLGPSHGVLHGGEITGVSGGPGSSSGWLPGVTLDRQTPQLSMWGRLDVAHHLLAGGDHDRQAKCHRTRRVKGEVTVTRSEAGSWAPRGLVRCAHYTCPSCGLQRARDAAHVLGVAIPRHRASGLGADAWMLTLEIPHYANDATAGVVDRLYAASAALWRSKRWRDFERRVGLVGRVRVLDVTFGGGNGAHPHFHVALFPSAAFAGFEPLASWPQAEREQWLDELAAELVPAWEEAVLATGTTPRDMAAFRKYGLKLSPSENAAAYFTKWGLADEVGASAAKTRNHLSLLDEHAAGNERAGAAYVDWRAAVDGRAWVTGLKDLREALGISDEDVDAFAAEMRRRRELELAEAGKAPPRVRPLSLTIRPEWFRAALREGWPRVFEVADQADARGEDAQAALNDLLLRSEIAWVRARARARLRQRAAAAASAAGDAGEAWTRMAPAPSA